MQPISLVGKNIVITGGSSGIGETLAIELSKMGAQIALISRSADKMEKIINTIQGNGGKAFFVTADVSKYASVDAAFKEIAKKMDKIHIVINNAGVMRKKNLQKKTPDQIDLEIDTNLKGVIYCAHVAIPYLLATGFGKIINTSSVASVTPNDGFSVYGATKAGINNFTEALAMELKGKITVNAILPGFVDTPMFRFGITEEMAKAFNPILPQELVPYYAFLCSDLSDKVTGVLVNILTFKTAQELIAKYPPEIPRKWDALEQKLKADLSPEMFLTMKKCKRILNAFYS